MFNGVNQMNNCLEVEIRSLVNEGYGFSRLPDGRAVFIPFVMPGERVVIRLVQEKKSHVMAEIVEISQPHPDRITPRCCHFGSCGGCHFQHIPYSLQLAYKQTIFQETLHRLAGIDAVEINEVLPSADKWNYRNAMQFQLSDKGGPAYADWSSNNLFEITDCFLPMPGIDQAWRALVVDDAVVNRIELRQNEQDDLMMVLHGSPLALPDIISEATASIVHMHANDHVVLAGDDHLFMNVLGLDFKVSAGSFFQTNFSATAHMLKTIKDIVKDLRCKLLMDVYCGVGLFSAFLAEEVSEIIAIESASSACEDFADNLDRYDNISLYQGLAEHVLPSINAKPDCTIVDPPRGGLRKPALQALMKLAPPVLIYVSCNPASLARDLNHLLQGDYQISSTTLVDMFPQTHHIEAVVLMSRVKE